MIFNVLTTWLPNLLAQSKGDDCHLRSDTKLQLSELVLHYSFNIIQVEI